MDKNVKKQAKNPRENANIFSVITFRWLLDTFLLGYKRKLEESDLYTPLKEDTSSRLGDLMIDTWTKETKKYNGKKHDKQPRLYKIIFKHFGKMIILIGFAGAFSELLIRMTEPLILGKLLRYLSKQKESHNGEEYYFSIIFIVCPMIHCFIINLVLHGLMHIGIQIRTACCSLIYRKILRLSNSVFGNGTSVGQMVNLLSNDIDRIEYMVHFINYIWISPIQAMIVAYILYLEFGWLAVIGLVVYVLFIPIQGYMARKIAHLTMKSAQKTDERLRLMNEVLSGVQIIKMYVWEVPFSRLIEKARRKEVNVIKKTSIIEQVSLSLDCFVPRLCIFISVATSALTGNYISAEQVFMITSFFNVLRYSMSICFPLSIIQTIEGTMSLRRVERFLMNPELPTIERETEKVADLPLSPIVLSNATGQWDDKCKITLNGIDLTVRRGSLVAIVGQVGAGKSSLLQAILRELPLTNGTMTVHGKLVYASQQPWIFASSVRQNILFGRSMDKSRYDRVIQVCQLKADLDSFPHYDETIVGERGISLSGGQRARINLARAVYADADIYLLDDPLSAVDTHVGRRIVDDCIRNYLKNKTIVLVTHQLQYLKNADQIVVMHNGAIKMKGDYSVIEASDLMKFLKQTDDREEKTGVDGAGNIDYDGGPNEETVNSSKKNDSKVPLELEEMRMAGHVDAKVYFSYFASSKSPFLLFLVMVFLFAYQIIGSGGDYFVSYWVNVEEASFQKFQNGTTHFVWQGILSREWVIYLYSIATAATVLFCLLVTVAFYGVCMNSSKNLHANMFRSIVCTTMYFFNTNPAGRILNRFSKDMGAVDMRLPMSIFDVLVSGTGILAVFIIVGIVNFWLLIPAIVMFVIIYYLRNFYIATSSSVKRLEGTSRSPVFDHVTATLQGLTTIRAFNAEKILTKEFDGHQDLHSTASFIFYSTSRAFGIYLEVIALLYIGIVVLTFLFLDDVINVGDVGVVITQTLTLMGMLQWGVRQTAEVENYMTSVERVLEYSKLEQEPLLESAPNLKPPADWPTNGLVKFKSVKLKYDPRGSYMLKDVNFTIAPREKIGIVGRTGAGKTSLIGSLFRLAYIEGDICIDGISTDSIGLHDFRSKISIIPQEPILFAGSLRRNLDPFEEYSDHDLWQALEEVELKVVINDMAAGLQMYVSEGGTNFSVGQRQLLCLARAIVRNNKIMVLDEATANVDPETDSLIQKTVRRKFMNCTVLTIAHRLNTIMDNDKVLVMDAGCMVEYDHPYVLLQNKGHFYNMVQETGTKMAATLAELAERSYSGIQEDAPFR